MKLKIRNFYCEIQSSSALDVVTALPASAAALKKTSLVARTESHQARFNNARAMFEKMGSTDDLDSLSSGGQNR